jgi:hypothetical protein
MRYRLIQLFALTTLVAACLAAARFINLPALNTRGYLWLIIPALPLLAFGPLYLRDLLTARRCPGEDIRPTQDNRRADDGLVH